MPWPESQNNINKPSPVTNISNLNSGGSNLFEQQLQPSTSDLFGSTNAFGQNKATFGYGSTPSQTELFGQQPQQQTGTSLFQSNTNNLFGSTAVENQTTGTVIKFSPDTGTDIMQKNGVTQSVSTKHHYITCMKEYENKSLEELRFEDYTCNRKGPQQQPGFGAAPFGTPTSSTTNSLFGQTDNKTGFGQPQGFGQTPSFGPSTVAFGVPNQTNTSNLFGKPTTFGTATSNASTFGFNPTSTSNPFSANQAQKPFSQPLFGTTTTQPQPAFGTGVFGQTNTPNTTTNLFQKPAQTTTGFNTGQPGFSFNQTGTTQASNLFQDSKVKIKTTVTEMLNKKILTLETTIESKEKLIDSTTNLFQKRGQTTAGFNTGQPSFSFKQTDSTQASNLVQVSKLNGFRLAPLGTSTSSTSTPGVGQSTLTFGVTNQTNTSSLFSKPPIFEIDSLKRELMNKTIVTDDKLPTKLNITSELEKKVNEAVDQLKEALKRVNEMVEMLLKIAEANMEDKLKEVQTILTGKWNVECRMFNTQIEKLNEKILTLETTMKSKDKLIQRWEENLKKEREIVELKTSKFNKQKEKMSTKYANLGYNADTSESESESELKKKLNEAMDKLKQVNEMEELLLKMKEPIDGSQLIHIIRAEAEQFKKIFKHILQLERNLNEEKQKYEDLRVKYEILEEEHAATKATLVIKETVKTVENQLLNTISGFQEVEADLKALKKTYIDATQHVRVDTRGSYSDSIRTVWPYGHMASGRHLFASRVPWPSIGAYAP
ncbi:hypothetical protein MTP99_019347 [Tenebrio molitor]|nr:hypothetical protein MTP99_019347 [Tenebrio molitor]